MTSTPNRWICPDYSQNRSAESSLAPWTASSLVTIRRAISRIGTPPTELNRRTSRTWRMIVLSAGIRSLLWNSQRRGPESTSRGTCHPGRDHPGMVGDIISEWWAHYLGMGGRYHSKGCFSPNSITRPQIIDYERNVALQLLPESAPRICVRVAEMQHKRFTPHGINWADTKIGGGRR